MVDGLRAPVAFDHDLVRRVADDGVYFHKRVVELPKVLRVAQGVGHMRGFVDQFLNEVGVIAGVDVGGSKSGQRATRDADGHRRLAEHENVLAEGFVPELARGVVVHHLCKRHRGDRVRSCC